MDYSDSSTSRSSNYASLPDVNALSEDHPTPNKDQRRHSCCNSQYSSSQSSISPRPILKTAKSFDKRSNHTLRWDEDVIRMHDAERGTRMKIDEPRTPYMYYDSSADDLEGGVKPEDLSDALDMTKRDSSPDTSFHSDSWTDSETDHDSISPKKSDRKRLFHQLRSQHYDMKEVLAKARWQKSNQLCDDDEDDNEDNENAGDEKNNNEKQDAETKYNLTKDETEICPQDTFGFDSPSNTDSLNYQSYSSISSLTPPKKFSKFEESENDA